MGVLWELGGGGLSLCVSRIREPLTELRYSLRYTERNAVRGYVPHIEDQLYKSLRYQTTSIRAANTVIFKSL